MLGYSLGFLGLGLGIFMYFTTLCSMKSFGVPYLSPYSPVMKKHHKGYIVSPLEKQEYRDVFLNTKRPKMEENISMKWRT